MLCGRSNNVLRSFPRCYYAKFCKIITFTVVPAKSDSGVKFCLQSYQDFESIDHLCINPIHRIGLIHK